MKRLAKRMCAAAVAAALLLGMGAAPAGAADDGWDENGEAAAEQPLNEERLPGETQDGGAQPPQPETPPTNSPETGTEPAPPSARNDGLPAAAPDDIAPVNEVVEPTLTPDGKTLYANGVPVVIKENGDGEKAVFDATGENKLYDAPNLSTVYGGGNHTDVQGDTSVTIQDVYLSTVYGGGKNADVLGNTSISLSDTTHTETGTIYGGGYSDGTHSANVSGGTSVYADGTIKVNAYGGGHAVGTKGEAVANVDGKVLLDIPSGVPAASGIPPDEFQKIGHDLVGGGHAEANTHAASATANDVTVKTRKPVYHVRGGGRAQSSSGQCADASVNAIEMTVSESDADSIYGAGEASGAGAIANAASVHLISDNTMVSRDLVGGGTASNKAEALVTGLVQIEIINDSNLHGDTYGGGYAGSGGTANVGTAKISLKNSKMPIWQQKTWFVAGSLYAGGYASGENSRAVTGNMEIVAENCEMAGWLYGGGKASSSGDAHGGTCLITFQNVKQSFFTEEEYAGLEVFAAGDATTNASADPTEKVSFKVEGSDLEMLMGGTEDADELEDCEVWLDWRKGNGAIKAIGCLDYWSLAEPFEIYNFAYKATGTKIKVSAADWKDGEVLLSRSEGTVASVAKYGFTAEEGTLTLEEGENGGVVWRYVKPEKQPDPPAVTPPSGSGSSSSSNKPTVSTETQDKGDATVETTTKTEVSGSTTTVTETQTETDKQTGAVTTTETVSMTDKQTGVSTDITAQTKPDGTVEAEARTEAKAETTAVEDGTASAVLTDKAAETLVRQAKKAAETLGKADSAKAEVVVQAEIPAAQADEVSAVRVELPRQAAAALTEQTKADVTVKTPVADVTVPHAALADLASREGGTVAVSAERVAADTVRIDVSVGGGAAKTVEGGLKAAVPAQALTPGTVAVLVKEDGTEEIIRKSIALEDGVLVPLDGSATVRLTDNSKAFADAAQTPWASGALDFASARGLLSGVDQTHIDPNGVMSRGMLVTVLNRLENEPRAASSQRFDDIPPERYYSGAVAWAAERQLVSGVGGGSFAPDRPVSREELAVMLYRYGGMLGVTTDASADLTRFQDADAVSGWAREAVAYAVGAGLMNGKGGETLDPAGTATRAEVAATVMRLVEYLAKR
ncbi:MAG: S-layer homology domain-containing protein [Eubacteriales bacterium]|nr:S-layer homology domain-containing protein [Eubacteriales bacterium]